MNLPLNDAPATAFALPPRLAAKAEPTRIAADEAHFAAVAESITHSIATVSAQLDDVRRAPAVLGQEALERDQEIHRLAARLRTLERYRLDLCLGRMVPADAGEPVYIGRLGLTDANGRRLLVDWRTPAAEPFFAATLAHPHGLASRRRYRWTKGRVTDYWDEVFTVGDGAETDPDTVTWDDDAAFIASLGASRSEQMRDVLGTIQADQDAIIRTPSPGALVVDGGPGTGKTVVALHRAAYLIYADPKLAPGRGGILFVGPSQPYLAYVADVLPSLGEDSVQTATLRELVAQGADAVEEHASEVATLKADARLLDAVEPAVALYEEAPGQGLLIETPLADVWLAADDWLEAFAAPDPDTPHNNARLQVWERLLDLLTDKAMAGVDDEGISENSMRRAIAAVRPLAVAFNRAWPLLDAADLVGDLWEVPAYLRHCAPWLTAEQVQALRRPGPQTWTTSDLPLLDAMYRRVGDPEVARRRARERARVESERADRAQVAEHLMENDDTEMRVMSMLRGHDLSEELASPLHAEDLAQHDLLAGPFAHIVVDEAQELTDAEWAMLLERCPTRSFTVVGDRAQARHGFTDTWAERLRRVGLDDVEVATLSINYRTPTEVMAEAEPVIRAALPDANVPTSVRSSGVEVRHGSLAELDDVVTAWEREHQEGVACVIGHAAFPGTDRVRSLAPAETKGLEFDLVVLVDPESFGEGITGAVDRYVAMTRATQELVVLLSEG